MLRRLKRPSGARDLLTERRRRGQRAARGNEAVSQTFLRKQGEGGDRFAVQRGAYRDAVKAPCSCAPSGRGATTTQTVPRWNARMAREVEHRRQPMTLASCRSWETRQ